MTTQKQLEEAETPTTAPVVEQPDLNVTRVVKDEDKDGKADIEGPKQTAGVYSVLVERNNNEKIATEAFDFEIPILMALHGDTSVTFPGYDLDATVDDVEPIYDATIDGDANSVLHMLQNKFNSPVTGDVVSRVYRDAAELADKAGFAKPRGKLKGPKVSESTDNRKKK